MRMTAICLLLPLSLWAAGKETVENTSRLEASAAVFREIMATPDKGIPQDLLDKARCAVIVPSLKQGAFLVGAKYGVGYMSCRKANGNGWTGPAAVRVEGGSFGFQIGGSETDVVMLVMNEDGVQKLLSDKFTLGGEGDVAAGPVGRSATAQTDAELSAKILSWSRSHGVFAGVALTGATLRQDLDDNQVIYGKRLTNREILTGHQATPQAAKPLVSLLNQYSPRKGAAS